jgi:putative exosortase-associated protein (TIGR04073 family)
VILRKLNLEFQLRMRNMTFLFAAIAAAAGLTGCQGPEEKLGRGLDNTLEVARWGDMRQSVEQNAVFSAPDVTYTYGLVHGFDQSLKRIGLGVWETATFLIPNYSFDDSRWNYGPILTHVSQYVDGVPANPQYPDSYRPGLISGSTFDTDTYTGFSGGDVAPFIPGSRFQIFDQ